jgi:hypothetical protein
MVGSSTGGVVVLTEVLVKPQLMPLLPAATFLLDFLLLLPLPEPLLNQCLVRLCLLCQEAVALAMTCERSAIIVSQGLSGKSMLSRGSSCTSGLGQYRWWQRV